MSCRYGYCLISAVIYQQLSSTNFGFNVLQQFLEEQIYRNVLHLEENRVVYASNRIASRLVFKTNSIENTKTANTLQWGNAKESFSLTATHFTTIYNQSDLEI